ncbi:IucA/IucC family protein [Cyanobacterium aponinum]|uniref:IucA/IucC family siderophore biosynthesis protein n=1 Tax=Cyanobacterium aponinum 0216 TaxID=2676140 RepID=A0A844GWC7_9CHRO|nr:IucA/IucC family siderophore biosynthesis protein [Cyanobacterium aponinum]MTF39159.1 IucA/IucC family siderophore biosynthesis protein [Cyanobacterium aponinum 0216]
MNSKKIAEQATIQSFLNCYLRETRDYEKLPPDMPLAMQISELTEAKVVLRCPLPRQNLDIFAGVRYWSLCDRHLFTFPIFYKSQNTSELLKLDYVTLTALISKELSLNSNSSENCDELILRVIQSCQNIEQFLNHRQPDIDSLYDFHQNFINSEQSLIFGHHFHPTPKSRQGFLEEELPIYSPETQGAFSLHYFRAHSSIILEGSTLEKTATELIKEELRADQNISESFKNKYCNPDEYALIPVHPWQAKWLKHSPKVQELLNEGLLEDIGQQGKPYQPTSSIRTVYNSQSQFMFKLSLNVKITNSIRGNLYKELERGLEVNRILSSPIGEDLYAHFPNFDIVRDPAYITIPLDGLESGFATILRTNPFHTENYQSHSNAQPTNVTTDATCLIALCQDSFIGQSSRLGTIIRTLAEKENVSTEVISLKWFQEYLQISLKPILWLYFTYGIALEAHQQNSLLELKEGYPHRFFYRDNQGYYYRRSFQYLLNSILPNISEKSETICDDEVIDERLMYYLFINNIFGLINAFGVAGLIDESLLFAELRKHLTEFENVNLSGSLLLENLKQTTLRSKANLLTRFHDMDELVGSVATQSVYVDIHNPLVEKKNPVLGGAYV